MNILTSFINWRMVKLKELGNYNRIDADYRSKRISYLFYKKSLEIHAKRMDMIKNRDIEVIKLSDAVLKDLLN